LALSGEEAEAGGDPELVGFLQAPDLGDLAY